MTKLRRREPLVMHAATTGHAWQTDSAAWYILLFVPLAYWPLTKRSTCPWGHQYVSLSAS